MPTIAEYLEQGRSDRLDMIDNLSSKGVTVSSDSTFSEMIPRILDISQSGITPTGTINITSNGTVDVTNYASANVNVSGGGSGLPDGWIGGSATYDTDMDSFTITHNLNNINYMFIMYKDLKDVVETNKTALAFTIVDAPNVRFSGAMSRAGARWSNISFTNSWDVVAYNNSVTFDSDGKVTYRPLEAGTYTWYCIPFTAPTV